MRAVIQRVSEACLTIDQKASLSIGTGLVVLLGIEEADGASDIEWLSGKISRLRVFRDEAGMMNLSVMDIQGEAYLQDALKLGNGVILAIPHLGNWEVIGLYCSKRHPMTSLYRV